VGKFLLLWLRLAWLDILAMLVILAISYVFKDHVPVFRQNRRTFAMWRDGPDDWYGETYISHAKQPLILSNLVAALIFVASPIGIILFMQIFIRNFWDAHTAIFGLLQALITMTFVQTTLKLLFGAMRPFFLETCLPDQAKLRELHARLPPGVSNPVWAPVSICQGDQTAIRAAMQSFPSGHTGSAATVGVFLTFYLNAKLKAFSDYHTSYWKMIVVISPLIGALCVAGLLVIDGNHHLRDVVPSLFIGAVIGFWGYRARYRSAFLYRSNHFPLPYHSFTGKLHQTKLAEQWEGQRALAVRWPLHRDTERFA
jgi:membrane-associated phospholipid phosphatase